MKANDNITEKYSHKYCNMNCNECPLISHPNSRMLSKIFNELVDLFPDVYSIVQKNCPNLTVCYDCRIDDFVHSDNCSYSQSKN